MAAGKYLFTSESVSMGHPDKLADQISDGVLDALLAQDPKSRVACETLVTTDYCVPGRRDHDQGQGRLRKGRPRRDSRTSATRTTRSASTPRPAKSIVRLHSQSPDIAMGVDRDGAGDQGLMFGYACNDTPELMPLPIALSHRIINRLTEARQKGEVNWLRPDSKSQVTVEYDGDQAGADRHGRRLDAARAGSRATKRFTTSSRTRSSCRELPKELVNGDIKYHINPTGRFVVGGPHGDCGLTGRKIIVDTYGGWGRHGGGAFSGKDPTKVDRSAAYMARHVAKNIVAAGLADRCEVQLAYAIGVADPVSVHVDTQGTGRVDDETNLRSRPRVLPAQPQRHHQVSRPASSDLSQDRRRRPLRPRRVPVGRN